jgi:hypothetical protein
MHIPGDGQPTGPRRSSWRHCISPHECGQFVPAVTLGGKTAMFCQHGERGWTPDDSRAWNGWQKSVRRHQAMERKAAP